MSGPGSRLGFGLGVRGRIRVRDRDRVCGLPMRPSMTSSRMGFITSEYLVRETWGRYGGEVDGVHPVRKHGEHPQERRED